MLAIFYGVSSIICLGLLIAFFCLKEPIMKYEAEHAFVLGILHFIAIYIHIKAVNKDVCTTSILLALWVTALYLVHCNMAGDQFSDEDFPEDPLMMPPFYFKRSGGPEVYVCEPLPSLNGPTGLPPVYYEEI
ncbi:hypothetical protein KR038_008782 [Drosophila bunnanda]|nr:hypothetical protein KR038_008782 [Drosophila bunnanda]